MVVFLVSVCVLLILAMVRNYLTYNIRVKAIYEDYKAYKAGSSYDKMMWDLRKWTYNQFYGEKK